MDLIRFQNDLCVTIQALGWRRKGRLLSGQHDIICFVAYPCIKRCSTSCLPGLDALEIVLRPFPLFDQAISPLE